MKIIIKVKCSCTWDYVKQKFCLKPGGNCMHCSGNGIYSVEVNNVIEYKIIEDKGYKK